MHVGPVHQRPRCGRSIQSLDAMSVPEQFNWLIFEFDSNEAVRDVLRSLADCAVLNEGSDFFFFSAIQGRADFKLDCELVDNGLITSRSGESDSFFQELLDRLDAHFGTIEQSKT